MSGSDSERILRENKEFILHPWTRQADVNPKLVTKAEGCHFWDADGKKYLDLASQLVNVNLGHGHPKVVAAIQEQARKLAYISPGFATDVKSELGRLVADVAPGDLKRSFFTTGGAESNEFAIKIARLVTGKNKIIARYRSYHGSTAGAFSLTGDERRAYNEPGLPGVKHAMAPYCYRCPFHRDGSTCATNCVSSLSYLEEVIGQENPESIAAVFVEGITGPTNGLYLPPEGYFQNLRALCDKYGVLLVVDEVMSGWGRTGEWFSVDHHGVVPDIITTAKGITNGMVPLGAVIVNDRVGKELDSKKLWSGLTYSGHPLAAAAGIATIKAMQEENLVQRSKETGNFLLERLAELAALHPSIGNVRGKGLFAAIELVADRDSKVPLTKGDGVPATLMQEIGRSLDESGIYTMVRPNLIAITPPLVISEDLLQIGLDAIDKALEIADRHVSTGVLT
ncbi:MAG: aminotransferase class III-fold pyridoxal phosphate-dependent enzyme [Trueperaceae bacterium]